MCVLNGDWNLPIGVGTIYAGEGLNAALRRAAALLEAEGATAVLTLAADVPLVTRDEIEAVLLSLVNERRLRFVLPSALAA